ncbi:protein artemis isoform X1 [Bombyx mori]|uniref:Protein artemis n=2 Tax=Bombyx mori TaxID=7091 RepID=A0A8R1WEG8_BOMMO|nr:protein artemis isoform X1 [Bombyx mori]
MCDRSSFHGTIAEIPEICVDNFTVLDRKAYFLSHCHADHTQGIFTADFLENLNKNHTHIYMSEVSATIVEYESNCGPIMRHIRTLKLESTTITLIMDDGSHKYLNVKTIPAGHCLGSVMFLFEINNQTILYTGDFRMNPENISAFGQLHKDNMPIKINTIYLDTTFQNESFDNFPRRKDSIRMLVNHIKQWVDGEPTNRIALHTSARYGYEFVFNEIYNILNMKTYVSDDKWALYSKLPSVKGITNHSEDTMIHLCEKRKWREFDHSKCLPEHRANQKYLNVIFSAMRHRSMDNENSPLDSRDGVIYVCFATHCSREELNFFVSYFTPDKVVGFRDQFIPKAGTKRCHVFEPTRTVKIRKFNNNNAFNKIDPSIVNDLF